MSKNRQITISVANKELKKPYDTQSVPVIKIAGEPVLQKIDLVFIIDTTGSMSDKIESLLATCEKFVEEFVDLNLDHQIAIVAFGDLKIRGDKIEATSFTSKLEVVKKSLRNIPRYSGGGNVGESSMEALEKATNLSFRDDAVKVCVLITDEPAHQDRIRATDMIARLSKQEFLVFTVSPPLEYFKDMANKNGGTWYQISAYANFSDLLNMFREMAKKVSQTASNVHRLAAGSVADYLRLMPPNE